MIMSSPSVPNELDIEVNRSVLSYLSTLSAHSDNGEVLIDSVAPLGETSIYSPDFKQFRYIAVYTSQTVFGIAHGMNSIAYRLSPEFVHRARASGHTAISSIGPEWISFTLFRCDWPDVDARFWARKAYVFAREHDVS